MAERHGEGAHGAPLIITAQLPPALARWASDLRRQHFPPERNFLDAHVTLFHALPAFAEAEVTRAMAALAALQAPIPARVDGLINLGRGTALRIHSPAMLALRDQLAQQFHGLLTAQDQHRPRLHITIQNKVAPAAARALIDTLAPAMDAREFAFCGLELHRYLGGPWQRVRDFPFRGKA